MEISDDLSSAQDCRNYRICNFHVNPLVGCEPGEHPALKLLMRRSPCPGVAGVGRQPELYVVRRGSHSLIRMTRRRNYTSEWDFCAYGSVRLSVVVTPVLTVAVPLAPVKPGADAVTVYGPIEIQLEL